MINLTPFELQIRADKGQLCRLTSPFQDALEGVTIHRGTIGKIEEVVAPYVRVYFDKRGCEGLPAFTHPRYMLRWEWFALNADLIDAQPKIERSQTMLPLSEREKISALQDVAEATAKEGQVKALSDVKKQL